MILIRRFVPLVIVLAFAASLTAADPQPDIKPRMTEPGKLLFSDDFKQPLSKEWRAAKGKWEIVDGAIKGSEVKSDMHGAVTRHVMDFQDVIIQYSFKLDGARQTTLSINAAKGHLCRVLINSAGITVKKDDSDKQGPDQAVVFETRKAAIKPGEWHTILIEIHGKEMMATLDGKEVAYGEHEALKTPKANFGLTVAGESVSFKNLRVWEAKPSKNWEANRTEFLKAHKAAGVPK